MSISRLADLPVEILHHVLGYFSAHEIFYTFHHVNSYIDEVLMEYPYYRINFKGIIRHQFDLVCQHILPEQVIGLTISDDEETPGLIDLFLSRFRIRQFSRLQALKLMEIRPDFWQSVVVDVAQLKFLRSFCFISLYAADRWISNMPRDGLTSLDQSLSKIYASILPELTQLRLNHGDYLHSIHLPCLRHLMLKRSTVELLQHIACAAPQLQTLDTNLLWESSSTELISPMPRLTRLSLRIQIKNIKHMRYLLFASIAQDWVITMNTLEQMMQNLLRLKHLKLDCPCNTDVINGQRWETIAEHFITFNVKFFLLTHLDITGLDSFRTAFWLNEKRWYVAYDYGYFSSVPYFATKNANDYSLLPQYTTAPDDEIFYQTCDQMHLSERFCHRNIHFPNVRTLALAHDVSLLTIREVIDVNRICNLTLSSLSATFPTRDLVLAMPNVSRIMIGSDLRTFMEQFRGTVLDKIRTLILSSDVLSTDIDQCRKHLQTVFPYLEHLHIDCLLSIEKVFILLRRFEYLSTASFCYEIRSKIGEEQRPSVESLAKHMRSVSQVNCAYRFDGSKVFLWIVPKSKDHSIRQSGIGSAIKRNMSSILKSLMMKKSGAKE